MRDRACLQSTDLFEVLASNGTAVATFHGTEVAERLAVNVR